MDSNTTFRFEDLTELEQDIVRKGKGWDGKTYFDAESGVKIELCGEEVAEYRVLEKGNQVTPEVPAEVVADDATGTSAETSAEGEVASAPAEATEPAPTDETAPAESTDASTETAPVDPTEGQVAGAVE